MESQLETSSTKPVPIEMKTGCSNSLRFLATQGATTTSADSPAAATTRMRPPHETLRKDHTASGSSMNTTRIWLSDRVRQATAIITPRATPRFTVGRSITPYAVHSRATITGAYIDSDRISPSLIQRFGYSAANTAARRPARSDPLIRRARRPAPITAAVPSRPDASRMASGESSPIRWKIAR